MQEFLGERIPLVGLVDNQHAITAVKRGYSKKLRCLNRTHRIAIGSLHENVGDEKQRVEIRYIESKLQKEGHRAPCVGSHMASDRLVTGAEKYLSLSYQLAIFHRFVISGSVHRDEAQRERLRKQRPGRFDVTLACYCYAQQSGNFSVFSGGLNSLASS